MNNEKHLNIVSFNIPDPPNYGGVIDVFYKIKALNSLGIKIHLHCFSYGRKESKLLESLCSEVIYYQRKTGLLSNISCLPYIINSRRDKNLWKNLNNNGHAILFEGMHTSYGLIKKKLYTSKVLLRSHNLEHDYYKQLARQESNLIKKLYFEKEAYLLKMSLKKINPNITIAAISPADSKTLKQSFKNTFWLAPFHGSERFQSTAGHGEYAIYHGNLSVVENIEAAKFLIDVFKQIDFPLVLTGKNPDQSLYLLSGKMDHVKIVANPDFPAMDKLVKEAHMVLLPTFQATGIKLKLIDSLYKGRHCIANDLMTNNTGLSALCIYANTEKEFIHTIKKTIRLPFTDTMLASRTKLLEQHYNNSHNAKFLVQKLFND